MLPAWLACLLSLTVVSRALASPDVVAEAGFAQAPSAPAAGPVVTVTAAPAPLATAAAPAASAGATAARTEEAVSVAFGAAPSVRLHPVPKEHPRLFGSLEELKQLAQRRADAYARMARVARRADADDHAKVFSAGLVAAIEGDAALAAEVKRIAMKYADGPIRVGHVTFGHDLALGAVAYDLCHDQFTPAERQRFHEWVNKTVDANRQSETHVFHNGYYAYKNWGIGLACYATYHESPRAPEILRELHDDYRRRAAPALELSGAGGGFAEGYYIHYWLYEWLVYCEVARRCEGIDYYAMAPKFYSQRAVAGAFEMYPGISEYGSRRPVPMGDGGGRTFGGDRDKALFARCILANYYRDDPVHQAIAAFNQTTPRASVGDYAYMDFLWRDPTVPRGDLSRLKLSHFSPGPGYVYARSSWDEDATYFFFKCGDRFTAHQHLDVGHFNIYKYAELAGDGGHYDDFGTVHDVNYHLRTIAHSTLLVHDPDERWPAIRGGKVTGNDGGQHHDWRHHNGACVDVADWESQRAAVDIADLLSFEDRQSFVYVAGDATRAYSPRKLAEFTRQIVYLRPDTFVVFDRVRSVRPEFEKTWLLQAMAVPEDRPPWRVVTCGAGRLFIQTLLPEPSDIRLVHGERLYEYGGERYPPRRTIGDAPACRVEVRPTKPAAFDVFLHVLTASNAATEHVAEARLERSSGEVRLAVGPWRLGFPTDRLGGWIERDGRREPLGQAAR